MGYNLLSNVKAFVIQWLMTLFLWLLVHYKFNKTSGYGIQYLQGKTAVMYRFSGEKKEKKKKKINTRTWRTRQKSLLILNIATNYLDL